MLRHRAAGVRRQLGDAKVEQLGVVAVVVPRTQVDVLGLQIAVDDALGVAGGQRRGTLRQDVQRLADRDTLATHARRQALAVEILHDDVLADHTIEGRLTKVDDVDDVGVADVIDGLGFVEKPRHHIGLAAQLFVQDLDCDFLPNLRVDA